jgi:hypothetical protein
MLSSWGKGHQLAYHLLADAGIRWHMCMVLMQHYASSALVVSLPLALSVMVA